jgi:hypothetical protein
MHGGSVEAESAQSPRNRHAYQAAEKSGHFLIFLVAPVETSRGFVLVRAPREHFALAGPSRATL